MRTCLGCGNNQNTPHQSDCPYKSALMCRCMRSTCGSLHYEQTLTPLKPDFSVPLTRPELLDMMAIPAGVTMTRARRCANRLLELEPAHAELVKLAKAVVDAAPPTGWERFTERVVSLRDFLSTHEGES